MDTEHFTSSDCVNMRWSNGKTIRRMVLVHVYTWPDGAKYRGQYKDEKIIGRWLNI